MANIFVSHAREDADAAHELAGRLDRAGFGSVFLAADRRRGIAGGTNWERELYRALDRCRVVVALCTPAAMASRWCFAEWAHARALGKPVVPVAIEPCDVDAILRDRQTIDFAGGPRIDELVRALRAAGLDTVRSARRAATRAPFPGLLAFEREDAPVYFGRDADVGACLERLERLRLHDAQRFLVVLGSSGSGKSSLLRAGVVPRLERDRDRWIVVPPMRPLGDPFARLGSALAELDEDGSTAIELVRRLEDGAPSVATWEDLLHRLRARRAAPDARLLLVVDQCEELLDDMGRSNGFLRALASAVECPDVSVVAALRSDFLDAFRAARPLERAAVESMHLARLRPGDLRDVVVGPARSAGVDVEPALVTALVRDTGDADALPLLAFGLRRLWEARRGDLLTMESYERDLGGLTGAIGRAAEETLASCRLDEVGVAALRRLLVQMAWLDDEGRFVRRPVPRDAIDPAIRQAVESFVAARLLVAGSSGDVGVVEVAHESLFVAWQRLARWLEDARDRKRCALRVERGAERWRAEAKDDDLLLPSGRLLDEARKLLAAGDVRLGDDSVAFVRASVRRYDRGEARRRRVRRTLATLAILAAVGWLVAWFLLAEERDRTSQLERESVVAFATNTILPVVIWGATDPDRRTRLDSAAATAVDWVESGAWGRFPEPLVLRNDRSSVELANASGTVTRDRAFATERTGLDMLGADLDPLTAVFASSILLRNEGRHLEAIEHYDAVIAICQRLLADGHWLLSGAESGRAGSFAALGRLDEAAEGLERAYRIAATSLGPTHHWAQNAATALVELHGTNGIDDPAAVRRWLSALSADLDAAPAGR